MNRPIIASSLLWVAAALLVLPSSNISSAELTQHNNLVGTSSSSSASLHKRWGQLIQRESLTNTDNLLDTETTSILSNESSSSNNSQAHKLLSKLPCFVRLQNQKQHKSQSLSSLKLTAIDIEWSLATGHVIFQTRGGATASDDEDSDEEYDTTDAEDESSEEEDYDEEYDDEYDSEYDESDDEEEEEEEDSNDNIVSSLTSSSLQSSLRSKASNEDDDNKIQQYDDMLTPPAMQQLVISLGVMFLSQRIDILDTKTVRIARFAFVGYLVSMQVFLLYVRLRAKAVNDRTEITLSNPLASLVQGAAGSAAGGGGGNFMVKALTDQMLSSTTTVYEYDLAQAKKMNSGLLMPMVFLYFLHFRMKQVQPLLMQTATGVMNMIYSPLFQVYVLGRNLERPFQSPANPMMGAGQEDGSGGEEVEQDEVNADDDEVEEESEEDECDEEDSDEEESEYDTDDE